MQIEKDIASTAGHIFIYLPLLKLNIQNRFS